MRDAERTKTEILEIATAEYAERGYSGARVDEIADRTRTTKRMIYYYFGGKRQLYIAVLERAYGQLRDAEQTLDVDHLDPLTAIRELVRSTCTC
jgi:AcrR family transcriptional regulator